MHSPFASPRATREVLDCFGLSAKHRLGQNFLVDDNVIGRILELSGLSCGEGRETGADGMAAADAGADSLPCVLEVGPGIGTLTCALLRHAYVVAVECDEDLPPVLAKTCAADGERLRLVQADALKLERMQVERACAKLGAPLPDRLVANLPYQVAATLVLDWFERFDFIESMTVMVQAEVADRMAASPATKDYGAYTVKLALRAHMAGRFPVPPTCFTPRPHVDSAVVRLERNSAAEDGALPDAAKDGASPDAASLALPGDPPSPALLDAACKLTDAAFSQRRKTIRNSMKSRLDAATTDALLSACGIDPAIRAETLPPAAYLRMARAFSSMPDPAAAPEPVRAVS